MSSSILDMSILDDSSEDEDEAILKAYVGRSVACPKKQNTAQVSPTTLPPELTQSSSETESEKASEEPTLTKEEIETKGSSFALLSVFSRQMLENFLTHSHTLHPSFLSLPLQRQLKRRFVI